ncbi:MAG TPA: phosphoenolpyruvate--protein phosphotransferase [Spirochaetia bacterium]|nr:phosphoenolpyruvate--protein phosphotransferase [Spirochaetia bacterium]
MKRIGKLFNHGTDNERVVYATIIAPGFGIGDLFHLDRDARPEIPDRSIRPAQIDEELKRILRAIDDVRGDLERTIAEIEERFDAHTAGIFRAQQAMLDDPSIGAGLDSVLREKLVNGEQVVRSVFERAGDRLRATGNDQIASRADDISDLGRRVCLRMGGRKASHRRQFPQGTVLVADELFPSDAAALPRNGIEAIILSRGSPGSHVALFAKEMGIPVVAGIENLRSIAPAGHRVIVDGTNGAIFIDPGAQSIARFRRRAERGRWVQFRERWLRRRPVATRDGMRVQIFSNVGTLDEAQHARQYGADGIGLFRLEKIYLGAASPPTFAELIERVGLVIAPFRGKPVNVRLLDIGGDKRLPYVDLPQEENPFLGRRGIRLLFDLPDLLRAQLRALLHVHRECPLQILVPMVTVPEDVSRVRAVLEEIGAKEHISQLPKIGAMIEVPAAALCAADIAAVSDFLSIGTNDLTQYTMAADRGNPTVAEYYRSHHPAVLALLRMVVDQSHGKPVSVCGDMAGDLEALPALFATGIRSISVVPAIIADVKDRIRSLDGM